MNRLAFILILALSACAAWARGGGGCFEEDTPIATPSGEVPIQRLHEGDAVWAVRGNTLEIAHVRVLVRVQPEQYLELTIAGRTIRVTAEHPFATGPGVFRTTDHLHQGEQIELWRNISLQQPAIPADFWCHWWLAHQCSSFPLSIKTLVDKPPVARLNKFRSLMMASITAIRTVPATRPAYNLVVSPVGTYIAAGVVVHNKGCFLPDTPVLAADGREVAISRVHPGDALMAFLPDGRVVSTTVHEIITYDVDEYLRVTTEHAELRVTPEHPFYVGDGTFKTVDALRVGDTIYAYDGRGLSSQHILGLEHVQAHVRVYNLRTDFLNTFFAHGIAVHNKGGGGGHGGGGFHGGGGYHGGSSGSDVAFVGSMIFLGVVWIIIISAFLSKKTHADEDLDFTYSRDAIARKADKTTKLAEFLAKQDPTMAPAELVKTTEATFLKLQECWQARNYAPMKPLLMPHLYAEHTGQLAGMVRNHEINMITDLSVEQIDMVNIRYMEKRDLREFTALITARARDYYVDDRTMDMLRGDDAPARFQEFWTFQWQGAAANGSGGWLLREIEQSRESDALKEENFVEMFTADQLRAAYGDPNAKTTPAGPAGPWLAKDVESKASKTDRLLNFLGQTDKLWNRDLMNQRAREVFLRVYLAREAGDPDKIPVVDLFPDTAAHLRNDLRKMRATNTSVEYLNLCVRKVELVLIQNYSDNTRDEFIVRISAHAQRTTRRGGAVTSQDEYVSPFVEYWGFGRLDDTWKLKEVVPEARGQAMVNQENIDEDSSADQLKWYYTKDRAN